MRKIFKLSYIVSAVLVSQFSYADSMPELQNLLQQNPQAAYQLSQSMVNQYAGQTSFDTLYASAAMKTKHWNEAEFALQRLLTNNPNNIKARFDLAQLYLDKKDYQRAQQEYTVLVNSQLSAANNKQALDQLNITQNLIYNHTRQLNGYVELDGGYDTNVNSATSSGVIAAPNVGQQVLDPSQLKQHSLFTDLSFGVNGSLPIDDTFSLFSSVNGDGRENFNAHNFDTQTLGASVGASAQVTDSLNIKMPFQFQRLWQGSNVARDALSVTLQADQIINADNTISAYGQLGRFNYPNESGQNVKTVLGGLYWMHSFSVLRMTLGPYYGVQSAYSDQNNFLGGHYYGLNNNFVLTASNTYQPYVNFAIQHTDYNGVNPLFDKSRLTRYYDVNVGVNWYLNRSWVLNANYQNTNSQEDLDYYQYRRSAVQLGVKYNFAV